MTITGPDVSTYQSGIDYGLARQQGHRATYVKLGGDNIPRYVSDSFAPLTRRARDAVFVCGGYWVTGGHDPVQAAQFFLRNWTTRQPADFAVLDNETLDDGNEYSDAEAAQWVRTVQAGIGGDPRRVVHYGNQSFMSSHAWPELLATGCSFIIANYNGRPFDIYVPTIPIERIIGHQYSDNTSVGGVMADMNAFTPGAFNFSPPTPAPVPALRKENLMQLAFIKNGAPGGKAHLFLLFAPNFYLEFTGQAAADAFNKQVGGVTASVSRSFFDAVKAEVQAARFGTGN